MTRDVDLLPSRQAECQLEPMDCKMAPHVASKRPTAHSDVAWLSSPTVDVPPCAPLECHADPEMPDCDQMGISPGVPGSAKSMDVSEDLLMKRQQQGAVVKAAETPPEIPCTANGKRPVKSDFHHCPIAQSFVRCGPHHRARIRALSQEDIDTLIGIWSRYQDDLTWPWYDKKPLFSEEDFNTFTRIAEKVVNAMVAEYKQPMVLDQATISNTNGKRSPTTCRQCPIRFCLVGG